MMSQGAANKIRIEEENLRRKLRATEGCMTCMFTRSKDIGGKQNLIATVNFHSKLELQKFDEITNNMSLFNIKNLIIVIVLPEFFYFAGTNNEETKNRLIEERNLKNIFDEIVEYFTSENIKAREGFERNNVSYFNNMQLFIYHQSEKSFFYKGENSFLNKFIITGNENSLANRTVFIFVGLNWTYLKDLFKNNNIEISGGNSKLRHIYSPLHARFGLYYLLIRTKDLNKTSLKDLNMKHSFHGFIKKDITPFFDFNDKYWSVLFEKFRVDYRKEDSFNSAYSIVRFLDRLNNELDLTDVQKNKIVDILNVEVGLNFSKSRLSSNVNSNTNSKLIEESVEKKCKNLENDQVSSGDNSKLAVLENNKKYKARVNCDVNTSYNQLNKSMPDISENEGKIVKNSRERGLIRKIELSNLNNRKYHTMIKRININSLEGVNSYFSNNLFTAGRDISSCSCSCYSSISQPLSAKPSTYCLSRLSSGLGGGSEVEGLNKKSVSERMYEQDKFMFSYLDKIEVFVKECKNDSVKAQNLLENSWLEVMKLKFEDPNYGIRNKIPSIMNKALETLTIYEKSNLLKRFPTIFESIKKYKIEILLISFTLILTYYERLNYTHIARIIGNEIVYFIYKKIIIDKIKSKILKNNNNEVDAEALNIINDPDFILFNDFKLKIKMVDSVNILRLGSFFIDIFSTNPTMVFERTYKLDEDTSVYLEINKEYEETIKQNIIVYPSSLPMLCLPNKWSKKDYGGFLDNKILGKDVISGQNENLHKHSIEEKENLYSAVNYLNCIKFGINNKLLNYLNNEGYFLLETEIKKEENKDKVLQTNITLKIAEVFKKIPFYLNVHGDWRGRIYTHSFFISYQSGDINSSLLEFWEGEELTDSGKEYLYIYGANCYNNIIEDGYTTSFLSKLSFSERINWVNNNYDKIINMDPEFLLKADSKFLFAAFCLIMKEIHDNPKTIIKLPIFLDATCSGLQHLSALLKDFSLASKVNLTPPLTKINKENNKLVEVVGDLYSDMLEPVNKAINKYGETNSEFINLSLVKLTRKLIKLPIMTKTYNVSDIGVAEQIRNSLKKDTKIIERTLTKTDIDNINLKLSSVKKQTNFKSDKVYIIADQLKTGFKKIKVNKEVITYICPGKDGNVYLSNYEIFKIAQIINQQLFEVFPSLQLIYNYFLDTAKLMVKLDIPITWFTPSGLKITQRYAKSKIKKISINFGGKSKKMVLREYSNFTDTNKQVLSIIPNIIHSLDASHLMNLINKAKSENFSPILTVHDCFGTHPNKLEALSFLVKKEFILLYTKNNFLVNFHKKIIQSIKDNNYDIKNEDSPLSIKTPEFSTAGGEGVCQARPTQTKKEEIKKAYVIYGNKQLLIPDLPQLGDLDLLDIKNAKYMIS